MPKSISENLNHDSPTAQIIDYANWNERIVVASLLLGGWVNLNGFITYVQPASYPFVNGLVCKNVTTEWLGDINPDTGDWQTATITIDYGMPENEQIDFGEINLDVSAEAMSLPGGNFEWEDGPDSGQSLRSNKDITPHVLIPGITISISRKSPFLQLGPIVNAIGKINSAPITVGGYSYPAEQVLFGGATVSRKFSSEGNELWDHKYQFVSKPFSWNKFFHKGTFRYITPRIYAETSLGFFFS